MHFATAITTAAAVICIPLFALSGNLPSEEQAHEELDRCISLTSSVGALAYWKCARGVFLSSSGGSEAGVRFVSEGDKLAGMLRDGKLTDAAFLEAIAGLMSTFKTTPNRSQRAFVPSEAEKMRLSECRKLAFSMSASAYWTCARDVLSPVASHSEDVTATIEKADACAAQRPRISDGELRRCIDGLLSFKSEAQVPQAADPSAMLTSCSQTFPNQFAEIWTCSRPSFVAAYGHLPSAVSYINANDQCAAARKSGKLDDLGAGRCFLEAAKLLSRR